MAVHTFEDKIRIFDQVNMSNYMVGTESIVRNIVCPMTA